MTVAFARSASTCVLPPLPGAVAVAVAVAVELAAMVTLPVLMIFEAPPMATMACEPALMRAALTPLPWALAVSVEVAAMPIVPPLMVAPVIVI